MNSPSRIRFSLTLGLSHWLVCLITQILNLALVAAPPRESLSTFVLGLAQLLLRQSENFLYSALVAAIAYLLTGIRFGRAVAILYFLISSVIVALNLIVYRVFRDHLSLSFGEGKLPGFSLIKDSVASEFDWSVAITLGVVGLLAGVTLSSSIQNQIATRLTALWAGLRRRNIQFGLGLMIVVSLAVSPYLPEDQLGHHPIFRFLSTSVRPLRTSVEPCDPRILAAGGANARHGSFENLPDLSAVRLAKNSRKRPANVILIILESVGSLQFLNEGLPNEKVTPRLAALARENGIAFDRIYNTFPATIRTHVPIATGGDTFTWGSVYDELNSRFNGPTLVQEFKNRSYKTALFSAQYLTSENMMSFYKYLPYDKVFDSEKSENGKLQKLNSWGVNEEFTMEAADQWISEQTGPFFLQFQTVSSHHPYSVPEGFQKKFDDGSAHGRYLDTLAYADQIIGTWIDRLKTRGILENTVIAIVGDHGQAFGDRHPKNWVHKNFLYEENIRNFLLLLDPGLIRSGVRSSQTGFIGDIAPTLLDWATPGPPAFAKKFPGQDLLATDYEQRIRYFHKNAEPELWGLLDGQYKFITRKTGAGYPELYDLRQDPAERRNLAERHPDWVREYDCLCRHWYLETNRSFVSKLDGHRHLAEAKLNEADIRSVGPKVLLVGTKSPQDDKFLPLPKINPFESVVVLTDWVPDFKAKKVLYEWVSPSGRTELSGFSMEDYWTRTWVNYTGPAPLEEGQWTVRIWDANRTRELIAGSFEISRQATLVQKIESRLAHSVRLELGRSGITPFRVIDHFQPRQTPLVRITWEPESLPFWFDLTLKGERTGDEVYRLMVTGRSPNQLLLPRSEPFYPGSWRMRLTLPGQSQILAESKFRVDIPR